MSGVRARVGVTVGVRVKAPAVWSGWPGDRVRVGYGVRVRVRRGLRMGVLGSI